MLMLAHCSVNGYCTVSKRDPPIVSTVVTITLRVPPPRPSDPQSHSKRLSKIETRHSDRENHTVKEKQMVEEMGRAKERNRETDAESQEPRRDTYMTYREK